MIDRKKLLIEILVATVILIVLLIIVIPHFLSAQRSGKEKLILRDLETFTIPFRLYVADHPQMKSLTSFRDNILRPAREGGGYRGGYYSNITTLRAWKFPIMFERLLASGYIDKKPDLKFFLYANEDIDFYVLGENNRDPDESKRYVNWGIAIPWPYTKAELKDSYFSDNFKRNGLFTDRIESNYDKSLLKPEYYFCATNGLDSFGFVYMDL